VSSIDRVALCYHGVGVAGALSVEPNALRWQIRWLLGRGYAAVTASDLANVEEPSLAITFDDADPSVVTHGLSVLREFGVPATAFVITSLADGQADRSLSWADMARLVDVGWEVGSHSVTHLDLTAVSDSALDEEVGGSKVAIERALGVPCTALAYPYGRSDSRVVACAESHGYTAGFVVSRWWEEPSPLTQNRVTEFARDSRPSFVLKGSRTGRRLRRSRHLAAFGSVIAELRR
jgi:peptidoglycan/xylan/chitin deacetylase (PgdA/CDA1 family)